jgi:putative two-component system response regulator
VIRESIVETARILVVDDEPANVRLLERVLGREGYTGVVGTTDARRVPDLFRAYLPDLVLLDLRMPHVDGFTVLDQIATLNEGGAFLPIVVLTADDSREAKERALSAGATDFISKPFQAFEILLRIRNLLQTRQLYVELQHRNRRLQDRVVERTRELEHAQREMLERLTQAVETRDGETGEHTRRVGENSARLASALGLPEGQVELIRRAAPLHDVGKIGVPDAILAKRGALTAEERELVKTHTTLGAKILAQGDSELMRAAEQIALGHHERWDGTGYPNGRSGEEIPLEARIVAVVDVFDALVHDRPYRGAWPVERALEEIEAGAGGHFDPVVAAAFLAVHAAGGLVM